MSGGPAAVLVSIHDVSSSTRRRCRRWLAALERRSIPVSLLVIPRRWGETPTSADPALVTWLRDCAEGGHELVLHGWQHRAGRPPSRRIAAVQRLVARNSAEFLGLPYDDAFERLRAGLDALAGIGVVPSGFVPPAWLLSRPAARAARDLGLRYTCTHVAVHDLHGGRAVAAPAFCQRPSSPLARIGAMALPRLTVPVSRLGVTTQLGLHPEDLDAPALVRSSLRTIDALADRGARFVTYEHLLATVRR